jgi:hypothetical protein
MLYFYHHVITISIIAIMFVTENYAAFFRTLIVAEISGTMVNLRNILFNWYGTSYSKIIQWILILIYFIFRGVFALYFSYEYFVWVTTMNLFNFRTVLHIISFIGTSLIVFASNYWTLQMIKQLIKIDRKRIKHKKFN